MSDFKIYVKSILVPVLIGGIVGVLISKVIDYNTLIKPLLAPPSILFPIVWTILYILMGISYGMLKTKSLTDSKINQIYYTQLFINAFWPILFFYLKLRLFSFIWIILLDILIVVMIVQFYQKDKTAGLIQIPYLLWSLFASYLNFAIYLLNN